MRRFLYNRRKENFASLVVALLFAFAAFFVLYLIGSGFFLSMLFAFAALLLVGLCHYLVWGRSMDRQEVVERRPGDRYVDRR